MKLRRITAEQVEDWNVPRRSLHHAADSSYEDIWLIDRRAYARYQRRHRAYIRKYHERWFGMDLAKPGSDRTVKAVFCREPAVIIEELETVTAEELRRDPVKFVRAYYPALSIAPPNPWWNGAVT